MVVIAMITAVGGGTIRDLLVDQPVFWITQPIYVWLSLTAAVVTFLFTPVVSKRQKLLQYFDAVGLGVFCVLGSAKGLAVTGDPLIAIMMGVMSAVAGGMLRAVLCNEIPLIFRAEIYATAAFTGSIGYVLLNWAGAPDFVAIWVGIVLAISLRIAAMTWGWTLPRARSHAG